MGEKAMGPVGGRGFTASRAELDALCSVMAATVEIADLARSEAAAALLRRALLMVRGRCSAPGEREGDFRAC